MPNPRKTVHQLKANGTYRKDRHADRGDRLFTPGIPKMPRGLDATAKKHFRDIVEKLPDGILTPVDALGLEAICRLWSLFRRFINSDDMQEERLGLSACRVWLELAKQYGLTPQSRTNLTTSVVKRPSVLAKLLKMRDDNSDRGAAG